MLVANAQANELLHRRVDLDDVVAAHLLALEQAAGLGFRRYIVSASTPFTAEDLVDLRRDAPAVVARTFPDSGELFRARGWKMFPQLDRVYVNELARKELGWNPRYDFKHVLDCLRTNTDFRSVLALRVGSKRYHDHVLDGRPYPVRQ